MGLSQAKIQKVEEILKDSIRSKIGSHAPEPAVMPFHTRLIGAERLATFNLIHSLSTSFGTKIFETVGEVLASSNFIHAERQYKPGNKLSFSAQREIQDIMNGLTTGNSNPNKPEEIERIRRVAQDGNMVEVKLTKVDLMLRNENGSIFFFDLKTAKPNKGSFKEFKRTLLEWVAVVLAENPKTDIHTLIAIPYNPYEPEPYDRWTMGKMMDQEHDIKVAEEFWDFLGGQNSYKDLLECFERVGIELKGEVDAHFSKFRNE